MTGSIRHPSRPIPRERLALACRESCERLAVEAVGQPVVAVIEAQRLVEVARRIPREHLEIEARPAACHRDTGEVPHETAADAQAACPFADIDVLEVEAGSALPGRPVR